VGISKLQIVRSYWVWISDFFLPEILTNHMSRETRGFRLTIEPEKFSCGERTNTLGWIIQAKRYREMTNTANILCGLLFYFIFWFNLSTFCFFFGRYLYQFVVIRYTFWPFHSFGFKFLFFVLYYLIFINNFVSFAV